MISISLSDGLSVVALAATICGVAYAKKQTGFAKASYVDDHKGQLSERHARYWGALREIQRQHKCDLSELSNRAGDALLRILRHVDRFDCSTEVPRRPLRHLLNESSEMIFFVFKGQLAWQSGLNIATRLFQLTHIEYDLFPSVDWSGAKGFRHTLRQRYEADRNVWLEQDLAKDHHFCALMLQLMSRIDPNRSGAFLIGIQEILGSFRAAHEARKAVFIENTERLEELIAEGLGEHFPISADSRLYSAMLRQKATFDTLGHLITTEINREDEPGEYDNFVSIAVQTCAVLHAVQGVRSWGWEGA